MSPSDLPWWGWILVSAATLFPALALAWWANRRVSKATTIALIITFLMFLAPGLAALVGTVRFVKWIWRG